MIGSDICSDVTCSCVTLDELTTDFKDLSIQCLLHLLVLMGMCISPTINTAL